MAEETIIADELDVNEDVVTNDVETDDVDTDDDYVNTLEAELEKAKADKEKWENRYKSAKKKESIKPVTKQKVETKETKETDLDSIVEQKLYAIEEQRDFIKKYGEEVLAEVKKVKDKHPTLSLEDAYSISPIAKDLASKETPDTMAMGGRANISMDSKHITQEQLNSLSGHQYREMRDKMRKGEVTLK